MGRMPPDPRASLRQRGAIALGCAALVLAAFAPVLGNGFLGVFDDAAYITGNGYVRQGLSWESIRWAVSPASSDRSYWHPLTWISLMLDVELFGVRSAPIHAENVALHLSAALLLFAALERMTGRTWRSAAVAVLFAVHPLQVEAVAWAVERKTVLSGALGMGALLCWARWVESRRRASYAGALALFAASLLAKPQLVTFPFVLLLLDVWPLGRTRWAAPERPDAPGGPVPLRTLVVEKLPLLALAVSVTVAIASFKGVSMGSAGASLAQRIANALTGYWGYLAKVAWPAALAPFYPEAPEVSVWPALAAAGGLAGVLGALVAARRILSLAPAVGWLWFLGALVPSSGLIRSGLWPGMADRFVYFPVVGLLVAVVWMVAAFATSPRARRAALALAGAAAVALAARAHAQALLWRDPVTLFAHAVRVTPTHRMAWSNLGHALQASGRTAEARTVAERMIEVLPLAPDGPLNLGILLHEAGDLEGADRAYAAALERDPRCAVAYFNRALVRKRWGDWPGAVENLERAVAAGFREAIGFHQLGQAYEAVGRRDEAERAFREVLGIDPLHWRAEARLGLLLAATGRTAEAARALADARRHAVLAGDDPRLVDALLRPPGAAAR